MFTNPTKLAWGYPDGHSEHFEPGHPERPERVESIRSALEEHGMWQTYPVIPAIPVPEPVLTRVHEPTYLERLRAACRRGAHLDADTYTTPASWKLANQAAGLAVAAAQAVWDGDIQRAFVLTRPPGHHATARQGMGFCLLNNAALAAEYLLMEKGARRIAILDFDLHHGNGTQDIFWERSEVFYLSTHQSPLYPGSGSVLETGAGAGVNTTANLPLPPGSGDNAFATIIEAFVVPLLDRYRPEIVLVSFGFDTHWRDPLGSLLLSAAGYRGLIKRVVQWTEAHCGGKIALMLEGGYDLEAAAACGLGVVAALLGQPFEDPLGAPPWAETGAWKAVLDRARQVWNI